MGIPSQSQSDQQSLHGDDELLGISKHWKAIQTVRTKLAIASAIFLRLSMGSICVS
jgi:hypothetical protein